MTRSELPLVADWSRASVSFCWLRDGGRQLVVAARHSSPRRRLQLRHVVIPSSPDRHSASVSQERRQRTERMLGCSGTQAAQKHAGRGTAFLICSHACSLSAPIASPAALVFLSSFTLVSAAGVDPPVIPSFSVSLSGMSRWLLVVVLLLCAMVALQAVAADAQPPPPPPPPGNGSSGLPPPPPPHNGSSGPPGPPPPPFALLRSIVEAAKAGHPPPPPPPPPHHRGNGSSGPPPPPPPPQNGSSGAPPPPHHHPNHSSTAAAVSEKAAEVNGQSPHPPPHRPPQHHNGSTALPPPPPHNGTDPHRHNRTRTLRSM